jgi:hypothetical protein
MAPEAVVDGEHYQGQYEGQCKPLRDLQFSSPIRLYAEGVWVDFFLNVLLGLENGHQRTWVW